MTDHTSEEKNGAQERRDDLAWMTLARQRDDIYDQMGADWVLEDLGLLDVDQPTMTSHNRAVFER